MDTLGPRRKLHRRQVAAEGPPCRISVPGAELERPRRSPRRREAAYGDITFGSHGHAVQRIAAELPDGASRDGATMPNPVTP